MSTHAAVRRGMRAGNWSRVALATVVIAAAGAAPAQAQTATVVRESAPVPALTAAQARNVQAQQQAWQADQAFLNTGARKIAEQAAAKAAAQRRQAQVMRDLQRDPRKAAQALMAQRGWGADQFGCLNSLWTKESKWQFNADNPSSSAYGIPQALPGNKMASAGADWATNPVTQVKWGLSYIQEVYGTPCSAWAHSRAFNWY